jgi:cobalt-precorrin-5B (C1)-methyltransferase
VDDYVVKNGKKLRMGYTTGSCGAAAAKAGALMLLSGEIIEHVKLTLPSGNELLLEIEDIAIKENQVICCVRKDAGDDPDVTHGLKIFAKVKLIQGITRIDGGAGIGRVTREGLACKVGEAAINPVPKKMIEQALKEAAQQCAYLEGFEVEIFVPRGEEVAKNTFNARLGIQGGISILGTTGIVEPMSEDALIETIKLEMNYRKQYKILFASPGNYGLEFAKCNLGLDVNLAVKCSNYIGEMLDYAVYLGFEKLLFIGHVGKLVKLAAGVMNTHSKIADGRNEIFAAHAGMQGAKSDTIVKIMEAGTTDEIHVILAEEGITSRVYNSILDKIMFHLKYRTKNKLKLELLVFSNENGILMKTEHVMDFINEIKELNQ